MSETSTALVTTEPEDQGETRPWHGEENPFEALYQWFKGEIERVEGKSEADKAEPVGDAEPGVREPLPPTTPYPEPVADSPPVVPKPAYDDPTAVEAPGPTPVA